MEPVKKIQADRTSTALTTTGTTEETSQKLAQVGSLAEMQAMFEKLQLENEKLLAVNSSLMEENAALRATSKYQLKVENEILRKANGNLAGRATALTMELAEHQKPPNSFPRFLELPPEIRFTIWRLAEPGPRFVKLQRNRNDVDHPRKVENFTHHRLKTSAVFPSLLNVCKEARQEILKVHPPCLEISSGEQKYFNHERDVLYLESGDLEHIVVKGQQNPFPWGNDACQNGFNPDEIRRLAINYVLWDVVPYLLVHYLYEFPKLEEIFVVNEAYYLYSEGPRKIVELEDGESIEHLSSYEESRDHAEPAGEYQEFIEKGFRKRINKTKFEEEWSGINDRKQLSQVAMPALENVENRWLATNRTPPRIRISRTILDREDVLKLEE